ncbi:F-box/WD repeat-containing protein 4 [Varanus komodoensis]|nr:F-box/WD repeat-containing protein 4 [Varanus komodoensis]
MELCLELCLVLTFLCLLFLCRVTGVPVKERVKVSQNWRHGRCRRISLLRWKRKQVAPTFSLITSFRIVALPLVLLPWMQLDGDYLYLSQAEDIQVYWLHHNGTSLQRFPQAVFSGHQEDVCRFVLANGHIVSGGGDGNIIIHTLNGSFSFKFLGHEQEVNCVDSQGGIIVSGSRDRTAKINNLEKQLLCLHRFGPCHQAELGNAFTQYRLKTEFGPLPLVLYRGIKEVI